MNSGTVLAVFAVLVLAGAGAWYITRQQKEVNKLKQQNNVPSTPPPANAPVSTSSTGPNTSLPPAPKPPTNEWDFLSSAMTSVAGVVKSFA